MKRMIWFLLAVVLFCVWFIQRYVFAPHYTEPARKQFILETLRTADFVALSQSSETVAYPFRGRKLGAHWIAHPRPELGPQAITVEFDVHPTVKTYGSISGSQYILIRDPHHLQVIKDTLKTSDHYEVFCVFPKDLGPPPKF